MIDARPVAARIHSDEPPADGECRQSDNRAAVDQRKFGRTAADIDMQQANAALFRGRHGARAVRRQPRLEFMAGAGADELPRLRGEEFVDGARVLALDSLTGEDDGAAVNLIFRETGVAVAAVDEVAERGGVDQIVGTKRRQQYRRAPHDIAADHDKAA